MEPAYQERVIVDNDDIRMVEYKYLPGGTGRHEHIFPRAVYIAEGGELEFVSDEGTVRKLTPASSSGGWSPPANHTVRNVGMSKVRMVEIEVKK